MQETPIPGMGNPDKEPKAGPQELGEGREDEVVKLLSEKSDGDILNPQSQPLPPLRQRDVYTLPDALFQ